MVTEVKCEHPSKELLKISLTVLGIVTVVSDKHSKNAEMTPEERKTFHFLTKKAFEHRRKQLGSVFKDMIQSTARAEELSNEEWIILSKGIANENS